MAIIRICTVVTAPIERAFDLWRSIDAHQLSTKRTSEVAIGGRTSGLINLNEEVVWQARHFGITQTLCARITEYDRPYYFQDVMINGAFARMKHDHRFKSQGEITEVEDVFEYDAPLGILGKIAEGLFLTRYMTRFLKTRNGVLKRIVESDEWRKFL